LILGGTVDVSHFDGVKVLGRDGHEIDLGNWMRGRATVLVFVRHFG
jgi:hypothetical protein